MGSTEHGAPATKRHTESAMQSNHITPPSFGKSDRMLSLFAAGRSLNVFEAQEEGDTCLNTTVSSLCAKHGLCFSRQWEKVRNRFGTSSTVVRYSLSEREQVKARGILRERCSE